MPLTYSTATVKDLPQLMQLAQLSYHQFKDILSAENWAEMEHNLTTEKFFTDILGQATAFTCLDGDKVIGVAYLMPRATQRKYIPTIGVIYAWWVCTPVTVGRA